MLRIIIWGIVIVMIGSWLNVPFISTLGTIVVAAPFVFIGLVLAAIIAFVGWLFINSMNGG